MTPEAPIDPSIASVPAAPDPDPSATGDAGDAAAGDPSGYQPQMGVDWPGMNHEAIGGLALGAPASLAIQRLGQPTAKESPTYEGATGGYVSAWTFRGGVSLLMMAGTPKGPFAVRSIEVTAPSRWKTVEGIGIGSSLAEVKARFGTYVTPPTKDSPPTSWLVGSIYGGLLLTVEHDRVTRMFLGAMAF